MWRATCQDGILRVHGHQVVNLKEPFARITDRRRRKQGKAQMTLAPSQTFTASRRPRAYTMQFNEHMTGALYVSGSRRLQSQLLYETNRAEVRNWASDTNGATSWNVSLPAAGINAIALIAARRMLSGWRSPRSPTIESRSAARSTGRRRSDTDASQSCNPDRSVFARDQAASLWPAVIRPAYPIERTSLFFDSVAAWSVFS